jgi:hypothetical protein
MTSPAKGPQPGRPYETHEEQARRWSARHLPDHKPPVAIDPATDTRHPELKRLSDRTPPKIPGSSQGFRIGYSANLPYGRRDRWSW